GDVGGLEQADDLLLGGAVEDRRGHAGSGCSLPSVLRDRLGPLGAVLDLPSLGGGPAEVQLEDLADVHSSRDTERVEHDVDGGAVLEERHVLDREDLGDDALVAVATGELVAIGDLALVRDVDAHELVDTGGELV